MGMMMWNQNSKKGENGAESPVINVKKSDVAVVEPVAKSPVAKVNSAKSMKSPNIHQLLSLWLLLRLILIRYLVNCLRIFELICAVCREDGCPL